MKWFLLLLLVCLLIWDASARPLDLRINNVVIRSEDAGSFSVHPIDGPDGYPADCISQVEFGDTQLQIFFATSSGKNLIDSNGLRFDPVQDTVPSDLFTYGSYNASIGGLPGVVVWRAYATGKLPSQDNYIVANTEIVGLTRDNDTEIGVRSKESFPTHRLSEEEVYEKIAESISSFNASLESLELHYLA